MYKCKLTIGLLMASLIFGCGYSAANPLATQPAHGSAPGAVSSPGAFKDDYDGAMTAKGDRLWLAKTGRDSKKRVRTQTLQYRNGRWRALPGRPFSTTDTRLFITAFRAPRARKAHPCVGDTAPGGIARVRCFDGKRWHSKAIPKKWRGTYIEGLVMHRGRLVLLRMKNQSRGPKADFTVRAFRLRGSRFQGIGNSIKFKVGIVASLVSRTSGTQGPIEVGFVGTQDPSFRQVLTLKKGRWKKSLRMPRMDGGADVSGPVRAGARTFFSVNKSDLSDPYEFSVWARRDGKPWYEVGGSPLNQGFGQAQGGVFAVGKKIFAVWSEFKVEGFEFGGWFPVETYAAKLKPDGSGFTKPMRLWKGRLIFPVSEHVVAYKGRPVFLYWRQSTRMAGMHVTVDFRSPAEIRQQMLEDGR